MVSKSIKEILNLNANFYQSVGKEFSESRRYPWKGWVTCLKHIPKDSDLSVLDIGCGNGRFYDLVRKSFSNIDYIGLDTNNDLLSECKRKYKKAKFKKLDIFLDLNKIKKKHDLVAIFGVTHHIPNNNFRTKWFKSLHPLVKKGGNLLISFWMFEKNPGDYLLGWGNKKGVSRYCHMYSQKEINDLIFMFKEQGLILKDKFIEDKTNLYLVFGKI